MARLMIAACLALAGCYGTTTLGGDARTDVTADVGPDGVDVRPDPVVDTVPPDVATDTGTVCVPAGDGVWLEWSLDYDAWLDEEIDTPCTILMVESSDVGHTIIELECGTGGMMRIRHIEIFSNPHPWLESWVGASVMLNYSGNSWEWPERWLALRHYDGSIILAAVQAGSLAPWDREIDEWYYPLGMRVATGLCPEVESECGISERVAVDVEFGDDRELVFDGGYAYVGDILTAGILVDTAWHYSTMECMDFPMDYMNALFFMLPEG